MKVTGKSAECCKFDIYEKPTNRIEGYHTHDSDVFPFENISYSDANYIFTKYICGRYGPALKTRSFIPGKTYDV